MTQQAAVFQPALNPTSQIISHINVCRVVHQLLIIMRILPRELVFLCVQKDRMMPMVCLRGLRGFRMLIELVLLDVRLIILRRIVQEGV